MSKILIVEDEPLIIRMYQKALAFDGFDVISALSGKEGIELAKKEQPDLIIMDIMMPEVNGIEALATLKQNPQTRNIPVIMLTNLSGEKDKELAMNRGAFEFWVKKEVNPMEVGDRIKKIISELNPAKNINIPN